MKKHLIILCSLVVWIGADLSAQNSCTALTTAIQTGITLTTSSGTANRSAVAYNPIKNLYYSCNAGSSGYPFETYSDTGGTPDTVSTGGISWRGLWWNSVLNQLEGNGFSTTGLIEKDLDTQGYALSTNTIVFTGQNQPNSNSCGDFDYQANEVFYFDLGSIYRYNRTNNASLGNYALNSIPSGGNILTFRALYTGCTGQEIAIYDYTLRRVYLFNKANGNYSATVQLPATAPQPGNYGIGYANDLFWVFDGVGRIWYSYQLFQVCPAINANITAIGDSNICRGDTAILASPTDPSYAYQWFLNGSLLPSATDSLLNADTAGNYSLVITDTSGCIDSSSTFTVNQYPDADPMLSPMGTYEICDGDSYAFHANNDTTFTWQWQMNGGNISGENDSIYFATVSGTYSVLVTTANSCQDQSGSSTLTVYPTPVPGITLSGDTLIADPFYFSYQWFETGTMIGGATSQTLIINATGIYSVEVTDTFGCIGTSDTTSVVVGLENGLKALTWQVFPVPAKDKITVSVSGMNPEHARIEILDIRGRVIYEKEIRPGSGDMSIEIGLASFNVGIYFIKLSTENARDSKKILVEK